MAQQLGLRPDLQRLLVGFMGCCAAVPALRAAQAIVLADPAARVLVVNVELCTLHLQETTNLEAALSFLLFGDGAAAALVTAEPEGLCLDDFVSVLIPGTEDHITWHIGDQGFLMHLSGQVPAAILRALRDSPQAVLRGRGGGEYRSMGRAWRRAHGAGCGAGGPGPAGGGAGAVARGARGAGQHVFRHRDVRAGRHAAERRRRGSGASPWRLARAWSRRRSASPCHDGICRPRQRWKRRWMIRLWTRRCIGAAWPIWPW